MMRRLITGDARDEKNNNTDDNDEKDDNWGCSATSNRSTSALCLHGDTLVPGISQLTSRDSTKFGLIMFAALLRDEGW
ncbi:hypothetical protein PoB_002247100 [Plakobranchus ocellatus]|uniref:Uncharacterized protein n=1 Tax=Plakobranchus ocellatus TaxID=259542 RepID=A0AAV3ZN64_9GAST|nr:hypothetical protein PoB_002247100 [Plakobranchus ocellatus]